MKKVLLLAVLAVFVMVPFTSFAKSAISEGDLAGITAQEGVTINFDNFAITDVQVDVQAWGDSDGFTWGTDAYTEAGWVGATIATSSGTTGNFINLSGNLDIDVGSSGAVTALKIGLPGVSIDGAMTQELWLSTDSSGAPVAGQQMMGTAYMSGITLDTAGYMVITTH